MKFIFFISASNSSIVQYELSLCVKQFAYLNLTNRYNTKEAHVFSILTVDSIFIHEHYLLNQSVTQQSLL